MSHTRGHHLHGHHHGHAHHPHDARAERRPSLLRLSVAQRVAAATLVIAGLWGAIFWAMT